MATDELFASLGGSLMKDLWADLQGDDGDDGIDFSLEQLEQELARLGDDTSPANSNTMMASSAPSPFAAAPPGLSAASLVVSHQNDSVVSYSTPVTNDAWSQSLEKFTAMSLEKEFLAADSARKTTRTPSRPPGFLAGAEDYNVNEKPSLGPPPGLAPGGPPGLTTTPLKPPGMPSPQRQKPTKAPPAIPQSSDVEPPEPPAIPSRTPPTPQNSISDLGEETPALAPPKTPQNSMVQLPENEQVLLRIGPEGLKKQLPSKKPPPVTPQNSLAQLPENEETQLPVLVPIAPEGLKKQLLSKKPPPVTPQNSLAQLPEEDMPVKTSQIQQPQPHPRPQVPPQLVQPQVVPVHQIPPQGISAIQGIPAPPRAMPPMQPLQGHVVPPGALPQGIAAAMPVGMPMPHLAKPGKPWQPPPQVPQVRLYCQVHPQAPPVPATALESSMMKPRDLAYILHSILKPILLMGSSPSDYDIRLLQRTGRTAPATPSKKADVEQEMQSRQNKTMEWMKDKNTLGHVSKSDVTRPRALLATPTIVSEEGVEQKQRASLWKARLYIDQGYQACDALLEIWSSSPPGVVPPEIQPHLHKLFKVLGMAVKEGSYQINPEKNALEVILKTSKGRTFLARLLERALLPPKAVQVLVPAILKHSIELSIPGDPTDDRLFAGCGRVIASLDSFQGDAVLDSVAAIQSKQALASQARMGCIHALLRRAAAMAQNDPSFAPKWATAEQEFMKILN